MTQIVPARKKRIAPFIVILILLYIIARYDIEFMQPCQGCMKGTANSNAKLVYTNSITYITKTEASKHKLNDGVYTGCLTINHKDKADLDEYNCGTKINDPDAYDGTAETFELFLKTVIGYDSKDAGYYYVMIREGIPVQAYWSKNKSLLDYERKLTDDLNCGTASERIYIGGSLVGGYPVEIITYTEKTPPYSEKFQKLNTAYGIKNDIHSFYAYNIKPLFYALPPVIAIYLVYAAAYCLLRSNPQKIRENKKAIIALMTEYTEKCSEPAADGNIYGTLYTRKDDCLYKLRFDGSAEDIENYLNNNTAYKRAKAYYKLRCEDGIITACDFGYIFIKQKKVEYDSEA